MADIINYDPNTGRKLNPGESVVDKATGKTVTQGTVFGSTPAVAPMVTSVASSVPATKTQPSGSLTPINSVNQAPTMGATPGSNYGVLSSATPVASTSTDIINYDPNTGRKLNPGESVVDKATGKTVTQGTAFNSTPVSTSVPSSTVSTTSTSNNTPAVSSGLTNYLSSLNYPSDYNTLTTLAKQYGITNWTGSTNQQNSLLWALKNGASATQAPGYTEESVSTSVSPTIASTSNENIINYDPNTGRKLNPGESVVDKATGKTVTQGTQLSSTATPTPATPITPSTTTPVVPTGTDTGATIEYDPNTGAKLTPGQSVVDNATGKTVTQGTIFEQDTTKPADQLLTKDASGNFVEPTADTSAKDKIASDLEAKFKEFTDTAKKTQEASQKAQEEIVKKMGETATTALMDKFTETQKTISDAYNQYFTQQQDYLTQLQNQPSVVDQLNKFREEQGLPQMEKELAGIDQTILTTEGLLSNIEADIRTRTEGLPVSEAAARRLTSMEQAPLSKQLSEQLRSRQYAAAGLEAKQATVNQYMTSAQADLANQKEVAQAKLDVAKEQAEVKADIANSGLEAFQTVQNQMNDVYKIELSNISSNADYQNKLAELGFDFYTQQQAAKTADINDKEAFAQELFKIKLQNTLNTTNPDYQTEIVSDSSGVFYQISINKNNPSDRIVKNLGVQGKTTGSSTTSSASTAVNTTDKYIQDPNNPNASMLNPNYGKTASSIAAEEKTVTAFNKSLTDKNLYSDFESKEEFIKYLQVNYPGIDSGDIEAAVNSYYQ